MPAQAASNGGFPPAGLSIYLSPSTTLLISTKFISNI